MPLVSCHKLKPEVHDRLVELLNKVLENTHKTKSGLLFTQHFLSSTEQTMLAKRVGAAILLKRGYTYDLIMEYLKLSRGTIAKIAEMLHETEGETQAFLDKIIQEKRYTELVSQFEYHLRRLIPPKGRNWSVWRAQLEKDRKQNEKPL